MFCIFVLEYVTIHSYGYNIKFSIFVTNSNHNIIFLFIGTS